MKRWLGLMLLGLALLLAACGSDVVTGVATASGDGTTPAELQRTDTFRPDDDLNLIIDLGAHNRDLPVYAVFEGPNGETYSTDPIDAEATVGQVLLGLDWEAQNGTMWPPGDWTVRVFVDDEQQASVHFRVLTPEGT